MLLAETDHSVTIVAGIVLGIGLFVQSVIGEVLAARRERRKRHLQRQVARAAQDAVRATQEARQTVSAAAETTGKVEQLLNGDGIMGALRGIRGWQLDHEQIDQTRHAEVIDRVSAVERKIGPDG